MNNYVEIENKYDKLISKAREIMSDIKDYEHNLNHALDVVEYTKELLNRLDLDIDHEVCIISAYWHDVGRIEKNEGHELLSASMLKEEMLKNNYDINLIDNCYKAIINHKWNMSPETVEGLIIRDADKLAFLGKNRWIECLNHNYKLDDIIKLLPKLKSEILYFQESKEIYDKLIIELINILYEKVYYGDN